MYRKAAQNTLEQKSALKMFMKLTPAVNDFIFEGFRFFLEA